MTGSRIWIPQDPEIDVHFFQGEDGWRWETGEQWVPDGNMYLKPGDSTKVRSEGNFVSLNAAQGDAAKVLLADGMRRTLNWFFNE